MKPDDAIRTLWEKARTAVQAQDDLLQAWRTMADIQIPDGAAEQEEVELLKELIVRRIYPANAFSALVSIDKTAAVEALISRYFGQNVDPDTKFGGYTFELSSMLNDLFAATGDDGILAVLRHPDFDWAKINDTRVLESMCDAIGIEQEQLNDWLKRHLEIKYR